MSECSTKMTMRAASGALSLLLLLQAALGLVLFQPTMVPRARAHVLMVGKPPPPRDAAARRKARLASAAKGQPPAPAPAAPAVAPKVPRKAVTDPRYGSLGSGRDADARKARRAARW